MSTTGGLYAAIERGESIDCTAIQIFTKNNNRWMDKPLEKQEIDLFIERWRSSSIKHIISHTGYLINLANPSENWKKSMESMEDEIIRAHQLGISGLVLHPGSHLGEGESAGLRKIADSLNALIAKHPEFDGQVLLETTAGQGTNLGYTFEQIAALLNMAEKPERFGVCLDTCHIYAAGYDITTEDAYHATMAQFDAVIGIDRIKAVHLNDTKFGLGSKRDRHEHVGQGELGLEPFRFLLNDPRFSEIPLVLETPKESSTDLEEDKKNLEVLRGLISPANVSGK
ncbi:MAG: deoxyribonuclease IV [Candidatus Auribacter fodinae]|jgi:deoxyribonuclease-4|uniref:Probable endonuclease 4 n=1 Tax=Candidatus Auribacter fodinae TaxID=2093366 RepID=A0A3A4QU29_9BACT|nr:MAG: deoxyribonuclease IV [Candidatus Auribacter fodinae]